MSIQIIEIPINQDHLATGKHAVSCPMNEDPHCDYCTCGLKSKPKETSKKQKNIEYQEYLRKKRASKLEDMPKVEKQNTTLFKNHFKKARTD